MGVFIFFFSLISFYSLYSSLFFCHNLSNVLFVIFSFYPVETLNCLTLVLFYLEISDNLTKNYLAMPCKATRYWAVEYWSSTFAKRSRKKNTKNENENENTDKLKYTNEKTDCVQQAEPLHHFHCIRHNGLQ